MEARRLATKNQRLPVLLLLGHVEQPAKTRTIIDKGIEIGFRAVRDWNVTDILRGAADRNLVVQRVDGWRLLDEGNGALVAAGVNFSSRSKVPPSDSVFCQKTYFLAHVATSRR
jgi:hypothetical protein